MGLVEDDVGGLVEPPLESPDDITLPHTIRLN
jgi:hypothetical protein